MKLAYEMMGFLGVARKQIVKTAKISAKIGKIHSATNL